MNTKWKIIVLIMLIFFGFCSCFTAIFISHSNHTLEKVTLLYGDGVRAVVDTVLEQNSKQYKKRIQSFLREKVRYDINKAFADRDKKRLTLLTKPYFEMFKEEDPYFMTLTWILPDNTTFLHMHDINKPSKDISTFRPDIVSANKTHQQYAGFANSTAGLQYRIVNPVVHNEKHIGILHFGIRVSELVDAIQEKLQIPVGVVLKKEQYKRIKNKTFPSVVGPSFAIISPQSELFKKDFNHIDWSLERQRVMLHDKNYILLKAVSLNNYAQIPQGHLFVALDISEHIAVQRSDILFILILSSILLLLSFVILFFGYDSLSQKILDLRLVEKVNNELEQRVTSRTKELRLSEKKFRSLVEDLNDWVWEVDENGVYTYVSPAVRQLIGYEPEEIIGKTPFDLMGSTEAERVHKIFEQHTKEKSAFKHIINANTHKNGQEVILETSGQAIIDEGGIFRGYRGVDRDITQRQRAEETIQAEKERLSVTLRSIGDAVITTDIKGKILFLNRVAEQLTGWANEEAKGKDSTQVFHIINERTGQKCVSPVQRVLELGRIIGLANHTALIAKDGSIHSIADSGAPIRDQKSNIIGVVLVFRDITNERKTEEELLKIRKLESVGVLAGGIAHDFNNLLSAILGNIELAHLRVAKGDIKTQSLLEDAQKAIKRATKLTGQLLTFSKGGVPIKEKTSLVNLITESADFVLHGSNVIGNYTVPDDLWMVDVDSGQIGQVIQNIVINGKHAMPEGGTISIQCSNIQDAAVETLLSVDRGNYVCIIIRDTGVGIPKDIINKVFDPYYSTKQEGSGLGLAICHSIINKHDGHIIVDSSTEKGTTFTIYLPAMCSHHNTLPEKQKKPASSIKALRIMIMDDEKMIRDVTKSQLLVLGHEPILVNEGLQAINRYQELQDLGTPVDLVIMDLTIPGGMGGQEAAKRLLQLVPDAKIIVASGYSNDPIMADYTRYGFCASVTKPYDLKQLNNAIASIY